MPTCTVLKIAGLKNTRYTSIGAIFVRKLKQRDYKSILQIWNAFKMECSTLKGIDVFTEKSLVLVVNRSNCTLEAFLKIIMF